MRFLSILLFALSFSVFPATNLLSQNAGYLGHKYQIELGTDFNLFQPNMGAGKMTLPNISVARTITRLKTIKLTFGMPKYELNSRIFSSSAGSNSREFIMPFKSTNIELSYEKYAAIAPLKRYFRYGIGVEILKYDVDALVSNNFLNRIEDESAAIPYLTMGLGTNTFVTDNIYINLGMDVNFSFTSRAALFLDYTDTDYYRELNTNSNGFSRFDNNGISRAEYYLQKLVEFQIGVGVNL